MAAEGADHVFRAQPHQECQPKGKPDQHYVGKDLQDPFITTWQPQQSNTQTIYHPALPTPF
ncbi:hypothetical protein RBRAMI_0251 [Pseudomonas aeruginosa RB]|nr:hypothetical protein RBRAMI_0251 [Pseudomonas aeruginosa RB]